MRNIYKVLSWDVDANRGLVTDGTKWNGEIQTVVVTADDLKEDAYLQGRLYAGETISAEEDMNRCANRKLVDILVENGARSIPGRADFKPMEMPPLPFNPDPPQLTRNATFSLVGWDEFQKLVDRVTALEQDHRTEAISRG